jgi:2-oxoglutarate/2-oxoacid ferredoxin oxidoreductase subunit beta
MTNTFEPGEPIWCAGCGHFGVRNSVIEALLKLNIPPHETMILAGIGCSGTLQNNVNAYGYHALHGRVLPTATGVHLANRELTVIATGGDGDGYAIGAGHLIHAFKRNPSFVYVLMNNGIYGLTKGQDSPTAETNSDGGETELDGIALGISVRGTTFLARGYSGASEQLNRLTVAALEHSRAGRGFAFLEVLSPCVTYNDTYSEWPGRIINVDEDPSYDRHNRTDAFRTVFEAAEMKKFVTGLIYEDHGTGYKTLPPPALQSVEIEAHKADYRNLMAKYAV